LILDARIVGRISQSHLIFELWSILTTRIGPDTSYWLGVLPEMIVIALGPAGAVAPLTTAVLMSVDSRHTGAASGLNSAVARTGGLVATALIGAVLTSTGPALLSAFGVAAMVGAGLCVAASLSALSLNAQNAPGN
jgi:predicted MFS family arabinose efflux permease